MYYTESFHISSQKERSPENFHITLQIRAIARLIYSKKSMICENHITKHLTLRYKHIQFFTKLSNRRRSPEINRALVAIKF